MLTERLLAFLRNQSQISLAVKHVYFLNAGWILSKSFHGKQELMPVPTLKTNPAFALELDRVCGDYSFEDEQQSVNLLKELADRGSMSRDEICWYVLKDRCHPDKPDNKHIQKVNRATRKLKDLLESQYDRVGLNERPYCIKVGQGHRGIHVHLLFERRPVPEPEALAETIVERKGTDHAVKLWQRMIDCAQIDSIMVIYDTPKLGLRQKTLDGRGNWSGSGEVAAAYLLGTHLSLLKPRIETKIKRWRDVEELDLEGNKRCIVVLGSSIGNFWIQRLRSKQGWKSEQHFHFERSSSKTSDGCIHFGRLGKPTRGKSNIFAHRHGDSTGEVDYALISFLRSTKRQQLLIALQGVTSAGTLAAAKYVCSNDSARDLEGRLHKTEKQETLQDQNLPGFECLLQVDVKDCAPISSTFTKLVRHAHRPKRTSSSN